MSSSSSSSGTVRQILTAKIPIKDDSNQSDDDEVRANRLSRLRKAILIGGFPILLLFGMVRLTVGPQKQQLKYYVPKKSERNHHPTMDNNLRSSLSIDETSSTEATDHRVIVNMTSMEDQEKVFNLSRRRLDSVYQDLTISPEVASKPIIYTFYTSLSAKETGMTNQDDVNLLQAWQEEWRNHGWDPRVIGIETAEKHPDFALWNNQLLQFPRISVYDRYCFLRWLAMATIGGWMSDYDTFPLHAFSATPLPNEGRMTIHEYSKNGGVPDLLSGTADEYHRLAVILMERAIRSNKEEEANQDQIITSDMFALQSVFVSNNSTYVRESNVMPGQVITRHTKKERVCKRTTGKYAIHFSHFAMEFGDLGGASDRATFAQSWLKDWIIDCRSSVSETR